MSAARLSQQQTNVATKRLELLHEIVPGLRRLAILGNVGSPGAVLDMREIEAAARTLGLDALTVEIRQADDIAPAFASLKGVQAVYVAADPLISVERPRINTLALAARLATMHQSRLSVAEGGLVSYGPHSLDLFRRAADHVDKILRGAKPAEIPIEQPIRFELVINLKTAKALGLTVPDKLLALADEVIE